MVLCDYGGFSSCFLLPVGGGRLLAEKRRTCRKRSCEVPAAAVGEAPAQPLAPRRHLVPKSIPPGAPRSPTPPQHALQKALDGGFASQAHGPSRHWADAVSPLTPPPTTYSVSPRLRSPMSSAPSASGRPALAAAAWTGPGMDGLVAAEVCHPPAPSSARAELHQSRSTRGQRSDALQPRLGHAATAKSPVPKASSPAQPAEPAASATPAL